MKEQININISCEWLPYNNIDYGYATNKEQFMEIMSTIYDDFIEYDEDSNWSNEVIKLENWKELIKY